MLLLTPSLPKTSRDNPANLPNAEAAMAPLLWTLSVAVLEPQHRAAQLLSPSSALGPGSAAPPPLRWLHCPRCGQSFAVTFLRYGCPHCADNITKYIQSRNAQGDKKVYQAEELYMTEECCNSNRLFQGQKHPRGHMPVRKKDLGHLVFMLRDPVQRMLSHHLHFKKKKPLKTFLKSPSSYACMTAMLVGKNCFTHKKIELDDDAVKEAVRLVESHEDTPFVGIAEYWEQSIALFHATFLGDDSQPRPEELENLHPTSGNGTSSQYEVPDGLVDPVDQAVYDAALRRFRADAARHAARLRMRLAHLSERRHGDVVADVGSVHSRARHARRGSQGLL